VDEGAGGRRTLAIFLAGVGVLACWIGTRLPESRVLTQVSYLTTGILLIVAGIGIARARNWARLMGGILCLLLALGQVAALIPGVHTRLDQKVSNPAVKVIIGMFAGVWLLVGLHCFRPSTKRAFAEVRGDERPVP